ncbi:MAG: hypothetical protein VYD64_01385, partial [Pseudomonadota bacterium]|nr:hypothetical protein [Pseudomonadota bacterium]
AVFLAILPVSAARADCGAVAYDECARKGCVQVLSVREKNDVCEVTMLVPGKPGKPPRKRTVRVKD